MNEPRQLPNRLDTLRAFIRNQAGLTDTKPPMPGPGRVELNHAEAMQVADWLDELASVRERQGDEREWRATSGGRKHEKNTDNLC